MYNERTLKKNTKLKLHDEYTNKKQNRKKNQREQKYTTMRQTEHQCMLYKRINNLIETSEEQQHSQEKYQVHGEERGRKIKNNKHQS